MHAATSQVGTTVKVRTARIIQVALSPKANKFLHLQLETIQGVTYEGIFKTFSQEFDVVLELAHKIDNNDPKKLDPHEVVDNLIFHAKDIVYMCAPSVELNYAMKGINSCAIHVFSSSRWLNMCLISDSFTDASISKFNGELSGEKKLEPWVGTSNDNSEECDLEATETTQVSFDSFYPLFVELRRLIILLFRTVGM